MKFSLSVTLSALAVASRTFAADLEDRSNPYYGQQQQAQEQGVRTTTVHDVMVSTTTATRFVTVTMSDQEQAVCTSSTQAVEATAVYQAPAPYYPQATYSTSSVEAQANQETSSIYQQYQHGYDNTATTTYEAANAYQTTAVAAQEQPIMSTETVTVTSTRTYDSTVVWATPTTVTQMEQGTTVIHTVDVTRTSTRRVTETDVVTKTKTKVVHETETETRTELAQETSGSQHHHNNGNDHGHGHGNGNTDTSAGTTTTRNTAAAETTTTNSADATAAATVADVNTNTNVATVTDFETSTFLVTTTVDGVASTETGTTTLSDGTTTTSSDTASTTSDAATIADATSTSTSTSNVVGSIADTTTSADPANNTDDPQSSTTLDPRVIENGFASDGQNPPVAGQVPSLTSTNNFINFCLTQNVPLTDGKQIRDGSCNPVPQGSIIAKAKIPSAKFVFPLNFGKIPANQSFTAKLKINNLQAGAFTNAQLNYYAAPAQVNGDGVLIGHSHLVIEQLNSLDDTEPLDPTTFAFFKGLNAPLDGDSTLSATLDKGLPAGVYRMFSINTAANHQPALASVAQHGSMDDGVYFTAE